MCLRPLIFISLAACATGKERSRTAAAAWLHCEGAQLEEPAQNVYRGCGAEVFCVAGSCRTNLSWEQRFAAVSERFSQQFGCDAAVQRVTQRERDYVVEGCGRHAVCALGATCVEYQDLATMLVRARASFSRETGCPAADISVTYQSDGFHALGCERAANCLSVDGPCMALPVPTCAEAAEQRYDECLAVARSDGKDAADKLSRPTNANLARSIEGTVAANRLLEECRYRFQGALEGCRQRQAGLR
jgi:hypothetical protein